MYSPKAVANYFLELAERDKEPISPMKLQKLVYYAEGWYGAHQGEPLIDEFVEAWQYGPVIPSLYQEFKRFGSKPITQKATDFVADELVEVPAPQDEFDRRFLELIWRKYKGFTASKLSEMTHSPGGPWDKIWSACQGIRNADIPFELMQEYFADLLTRAKKKAEDKAVEAANGEAA